MAQELLDDWGVVDQGDHAQAPLAARTGQDVEPEGPAHQIRPQPAPSRKVAACARNVSRCACTIW